MNKEKPTSRGKSILPKTIMVYWNEYENDERHLVVADDVDSIERGTKVGIYELKEIKKVEKTARLI